MATVELAEPLAALTARQQQTTIVPRIQTTPHIHIDARAARNVTTPLPNPAPTKPILGPNEVKPPNSTTVSAAPA